MEIVVQFLFEPTFAHTPSLTTACETYGLPGDCTAATDIHSVWDDSWEAVPLSMCVLSEVCRAAWCRPLRTGSSSHAGGENFL